MKFYFKVLLSILLFAIWLFSLSWGAYFMNQPDNLLLLGSIVGLFTITFVVYLGIKKIWKDEVKSIYKKGEEYAKKIA